MAQTGFTIITPYNSSTPGAVPTLGSLTIGEIAINLRDKRLFSRDDLGNVVEIGTNPSTIVITSGSINNASIGATTRSTGAFTTLSSNNITTLGVTTATSLNSTPIGNTTPTTGAFTTLSATDLTTTGNTILGNAMTDTLNVGAGGIVKNADGSVSFHQQAMTLTQSGNLLIGTTTDNTSKLQVSGASATLSVTNNDGTNATNLSSAPDGSNGLFVAANWSAGGSELSLVSSNTAGDGIYLYRAGASYAARQSLASFGPTLTRFYTGNVERARITPGGYFKASNTGVYGAAANEHEFYNTADAAGLVSTGTNTGSNVRGYVSALPLGAAGLHYLAVTNSATVYRVLANGNVENTNNFYGAISDRKLKEIIQGFDATKRAALMQKWPLIQWHIYTLLSDPTDKKLLGVIAQELEELFPSIVTYTDDCVKETRTRTVGVPAVLDEDGNEVTAATTREEEYTENVPTGTRTAAVGYSVLYMLNCIVTQELLVQNQSLESRLSALEAKTNGANA